MTSAPAIHYRINLTYQDRRSRYYAEDLGNGVLLKMVQIPAGTFVMGSPDDEADRSKSEGPQHQVTLAEFFIGMYPVTQAQWRAIANLEPVQITLEPDPSNFKGDNRPVEQVSWWEAVEFCDRLSRKTGRQYRLPTEAEWEYGCRAKPSPPTPLPAGEGSVYPPFHFGETLTTDLANYNGTSESYGAYGRGPKGIERGETTDVGSFPANGFGLYDMHGNVWEWCADHWHDSYTDKPEALKQDGNTPWLSKDKQASRLLRGGAWFFNPWDCRSAYRSYCSPDLHNSNIGFRVCCAAPRALQ